MDNVSQRQRHIERFSGGLNPAMAAHGQCMATELFLLDHQIGCLGKLRSAMVAKHVNSAQRLPN